jgi:hypothetical protein
MNKSIKILVAKILLVLSIILTIIFLYKGIGSLVNTPKPIDRTIYNALNTRIDVNNFDVKYFSVNYDEEYYIGLQMMKRETIFSDSVYKLAFEDVGAHNKKLDLDFNWKLYEDGNLISSGNGIKFVKGMNGEIITFAEFEAQTNKKYKIEFMPGVNFRIFGETEPELKVGILNASISVGIAFGHGVAEKYSKPIGIIFIVFGGIFSFFSFLFVKYLRKNI